MNTHLSALTRQQLVVHQPSDLWYSATSSSCGLRSLSQSLLRVLYAVVTLCASKTMVINVLIINLKRQIRGYNWTKFCAVKIRDAINKSRSLESFVEIQQTGYVRSTLVYCSVNQRWANVSCLLGRVLYRVGEETCIIWREISKITSEQHSYTNLVISPAYLACLIRPGRRPGTYKVCFAWVLFRGKRGAVCGKRLTFLYTSLNMSNITFEVPTLGTLIFKKCSKKCIHE